MRNNKLLQFKFILILLSFITFIPAIGQSDTIYSFTEDDDSIRISYNLEFGFMLNTNNKIKSIQEVVNVKKVSIICHFLINSFNRYKLNYEFDKKDDFYTVVLREYKNALIQEAKYPSNIFLRTWHKDSTMFIYLNDSLNKPYFGAFYKKYGSYFIKGVIKMDAIRNEDLTNIDLLEKFIRSLVVIID